MTTNAKAYPTEEGKFKARRLTNRTMVTQLKTKLETDLSADLSDILKQQAASYPRLVEELALVKSKPDPPSPARSVASSELPYVLTDGAFEITHTLSDDTRALLLGEETAPDKHLSSPHRLSPDSVDVLNQLLRQGELLHELHSNWVVGLGNDMVVKIGPSIDLDHIDNLQYVNDNVPGVPTPRFHGALRCDQQVYIFLSRAPGVILESVWSELTRTQKLSVQQQLTALFHTLRAQPLPSDGFRLGGFKSGLCKDVRRSARVSSEALLNEPAFNDFLCRKEGRTHTPWVSMIRSSLRDDHRIVMTHADLHPRNIMVNLEAEKGGERAIHVSSILDWEYAGWYPEHWEFVKALNTFRHRGPLRDWYEYLPTEAIGKHFIEYSLDCQIDRWLG